jgi:NADPH:quinone reductase-like Zn-dependent oxidoreductase
MKPDFVNGLLRSRAGRESSVPVLDPLLLGGRGMTLGSISVGSCTDFEAMNRAISLHQLRPVVDRVFPFDQAPDAYRYFESRAHFGKVVVSHG